MNTPAQVVDQLPQIHVSHREVALVDAVEGENCPAAGRGGAFGQADQLRFWTAQGVSPPGMRTISDCTTWRRTLAAPTSIGRSQVISPRWSGAQHCETADSSRILTNLLLSRRLQSVHSGSAIWFVCNHHQ
jgi:hypothetical protein